MEDDTVLAFGFPAVARKKVSAAFDGGMLSSDGGVLLLRDVEKACGIAKRLSACLKDKRDPDLIMHTVEEMMRLRMFAIAAGYEDANDFDRLRHDPVFKMAAGRSPGDGEALCSQPTLSRLENAPSRTELGRMMLAMIDQFISSYRRAPKSIILDIDDTFDAVHGNQQLSLFNAHYDERCFLPIHIYEGITGKPVAMILREGKTPSGKEVRTILKHVIKHIRRRWPKVGIVVRGDSHYGRHEAMQWCEQHGVDYVFGFGTNAVLAAMVRDDADTPCVERAVRGAQKLRGFRKFRYGAKSWKCARRLVARIEATEKGLDIRYIVTSLKGGAKHLYETVYCARGEMENFIKLHKAQLASDRTSCRDPRANQFRLILHTAAYWLMLAVRKAVPRRSALYRCEFSTLRLRLIKIAARVVEGAARIRISLPTACPDAALFRLLVARFAAAGP